MAKIIVCEDCGEEKEHYANGLCSSCYKHQRHYSRGNACVGCGRTITNEAMRCRSCANRLRSNGRKGKDNGHWKGGIIEREGRVYVHAPANPMANRQGYVRRSRLVLAQKLGRPLSPEEICHHINSDPRDDRPCNLRLFGNHSEHTRHDQKIRKARRLWNQSLLENQEYARRISRAMPFVAA